MDRCLVTKKSNCKNCYKCIRHCPIKSLRMTEGQAHIIREECILCGECYVVCPQYAKQIRNDVAAAKEWIASGYEVYLSIAPAYAARYVGHSFDDLEAVAKQLGFAGAAQTAEGATVVKREYERMIAQKEQSVIISTCCHSVNVLVEKHFKEALPFMANVSSPMLVHGKMLKAAHPDCKVVFVGPCISKKEEAEKFEGMVDTVLTFDEFDEWLAEERISLPASDPVSKKYRANFFPTSGGILKSMDLQDDFHYLVVDGTEECIAALKEVIKGNLNNCFIEMSICKGSCINGPVFRKNGVSPIQSSLAISGQVDEGDYDVKQPEKHELVKRFEYSGVPRVTPGRTAIDEILRKMGKTSPERELNCGSCGYNTCREKAEAVLLGKAELTMCLPYFMEKAESFSDTIIQNTPNGIIVLDEQLEIQQMNSAAKKILNLQKLNPEGEPVARILDPVDYVLALDAEKNVYDNKKYLAEYQKYVEETIVYDKEYHILMILMKDITADEQERDKKEEKSQAAIEITDKVIEKQMRVVQEIASLLGETTAETKIALNRLKETLSDE
ncbi:MAG: histidine kinase [Ruminococcaceae bacterium]|nr:histidine kinase [Oscillospiraceae bacterium]